MKRLGIVVLALSLGSCETIGDHTELAKRALAGLCTAPSDGLAVIFPDPTQRTALHLLCAVLGYNPRLQ